ncbi:phosphotransferase family protein [Leifsonia sp. H3M29-4]|uniref:phosphotransferase family protein n=1 Tax=Salinibacterium metalliresistens TaxID=3031321 RepID=UPI0023DCB72A|nr:phosphotransferase family protein [Salinibacterium metalliresistens]MDF1478605.1 phosphotransferase family protein [Salinibacterium metalliresistens]
MIRDLPGLDITRFEGWLREHHPHLLTDEPLTATLITGGLSNLSYAIHGGARAYVLRRPPLGHVLASAHDMGREYRVMSAIGGSGIPVPRTRLLHHDDDGAAGVGTEFYLMDLVEGSTLRSPAETSEYSPRELRMLGPELVGVLADIHDLDWRARGLGEFGRPDGFLERQVSRWRRQLDQSRSRDLPALDALFERVSTGIPETTSVSIVHGDYRLDNTLIARTPARPVVTAVLDWEMSTIGDSLTDLGLLGVYWHLHDVPGAAESPLASAIRPGGGFSSFPELVDIYARCRARRVPDLSWYLAFASFKLAVVLEGIHYRHTRGQTVGTGFDTIGGLVPGLAERGLNSLMKRKA